MNPSNSEFIKHCAKCAKRWCDWTGHMGVGVPADVAALLKLADKYTYEEFQEVICRLAPRTYYDAEMDMYTLSAIWRDRPRRLPKV